VKEASIVLALIAVGCGSSGSSGGGGAPAKLVTQSGRVIDFLPCSTQTTVVAGATVTVGAQSTTTAADGTYSLKVPAGEPFTMVVTKTTSPAYVQLIEEENVVEGDYARGDTKLVPTSTAQLLSSALPSYDDTRALVSVELVKTGSCADLGGTTVAVAPSSASALTQYPAACVSPVSSNAYVTDGVFPAAVVYDLAPGTVSVTATSPKCKQAPFPYTDPTTGLTYDGKVETQAGTGTSFVRIFMQ
jgi:hypothetical protein